MMEEKNKHFTDREIEELLSPRCDFRTSPGFVEKVMDEARASVPRRRRPLAWLAYAGAAAAVAAMIVTAVSVCDEPIAPLESVPTVSAVLPSTDDKATTPHHPMVTQEETPVKEKKETPVATKKKRRNIAGATVNDSAEPSETQPSIAGVTTKDDLPPINVNIKGPMLSRSEIMGQPVGKRLLSTDETDSYLLMVRSAYIEQSRDGIAETAAYVKEMRQSEMLNNIPKNNK